MKQVAAAFLVLIVWAGSAAAQRDARGDLNARIAAGDSAWAREQHAAAFASYDAVVRSDSAYSTRALFRVGLLHAWAGRFGPALAAQRLYVKLEPADTEGRVALARSYAWDSRFAESLAQYDSILAGDANYRDAILGRAQALAWSDRIPDAESSLESWLARRADDAEAWALLGQFRRWRGESRLAQDALVRALAVDSTNASAKEQMAWVRADIAPTFTWQFVGAEDSEGNTLWHREVGVQALTRSGIRYGVSARLREASVTDNDAITVPGAVAFVQWHPRHNSIVWRAELGVISYPYGTLEQVTRPRGAFRGTGTPHPRLRVSGGISHEPFDEVLSTAVRGTMFSVADLDVAWRASPRVQLGVSGSLATVDLNPGPMGNSRHTAMGALRFTPRRGTQVALTHRQVAWDHPQYGIFFAPQTWAVTEAALSWERTQEVGLVLAGDLAVGSQGVAFESNPRDRSLAPRAAMRLGWRPVPGREIVLGLVYANVAGAGAITASEYSYGAATLTGRWVF